MTSDTEALELVNRLQIRITDLEFENSRLRSEIAILRSGLTEPPVRADIFGVQFRSDPRLGPGQVAIVDRAAPYNIVDNTGGPT